MNTGQPAEMSHRASRTTRVGGGRHIEPSGRDTLCPGDEGIERPAGRVATGFLTGRGVGVMVTISLKQSAVGDWRVCRCQITLFSDLQLGGSDQACPGNGSRRTSAPRAPGPRGNARADFHDPARALCRRQHRKPRQYPRRAGCLSIVQPGVEVAPETFLHDAGIAGCNRHLMGGQRKYRTACNGALGGLISCSPTKEGVK